MSEQILIYGANGYTGTLVARRAVERGLRPTLAGRNAKAIEEVAQRLDLPHLTVSLDDSTALEAALRGRTVVIHCAGPFSRTSRPMVDACLRTGVHYLDITGELTVFEELHRRDAEARAAGVMLMPGVGFDVVPSDCLAKHLQRRLPTATHLVLAFRGLGRISRGTALTALESLGREGAIRRDGELVPVPLGELVRQVDFGDGPVDVVAIPWGDLNTAYYSTGIPNIAVFAYVGRLGTMLVRQGWLVATLTGLPIARMLLRQIIARRPAGPSDFERAVGQSMLWGEVTDSEGRCVASRLHLPEAYTLTAMTAVLIAEKVLANQAPPGFQTPALAYGPDLILEVAGVKRVDLEEYTVATGATPAAVEAPPPLNPAPAQPDELTAAEEALARLEDRIGAFTGYTLASDFLELQEIFAGSFERVKEEDWNRRIDRRTDNWTMRQALAYTVAVTELYQQAIRAGLDGRPFEAPELTDAADLATFRQAAIEARAEAGVDELVAAFLNALGDAARLAAPLQADSLGRLAPAPFFSTTPTVAELFGCILAHAGIVRGVQLAASRTRPIWIFFRAGMMRRQLTRFVHLLGFSYRPERGGDLYATIGINIEGQGGGSWTLRIGPEGGQGKLGRVRTTDVTLTFASADLFCRVVTEQTSPLRHVLMRRIGIGGNLALARRLPQLFVLTP